MKLKESENIFVLGIFLGVIALVSALVLALVSDLTAGPIAAAAAANEKQALRRLNLPDFDNNPSADRIEVESPGGLKVIFMRAEKNGVAVGCAAKAVSRGYSGPIDLLCGLDAGGKFTAVLITHQTETPGLGASVCERKFRKTIFNFMKPAPKGLPPNPVLDQFTGKRAVAGPEWKVKKDGGAFEFKTGATVTSRAVTKGVSEIGAAFALNRARILGAASQTKPLRRPAKKGVVEK